MAISKSKSDREKIEFLWIYLERNRVSGEIVPVAQKPGFSQNLGWVAKYLEINPVSGEIVPVAQKPGRGRKSRLGG
ncbi:MAG: hypothetical protein EAZ60_12945 [Oscillatoriales cyanobacterium]|uniref:hypothetical protein n=1 Tax=unclassified Microcoleus TaxID=2642155 RepID=UPI001DF08EAE|nr:MULTISPECIES: hypothetical protein [unclassified Microcoleus]MCC3530609.1 hypothetical protein [Microcoleus sp. PH2017_21_RUC_O_A]TAE79604.1 MAG: hypothetical protein EAZ83_20975 [Oscillatoriales cyanobacterium]MCC3542996.1 hypothetical protein [Microcoleus sp. PH2017_22_RUC_O_B]MCC3561561.1 hypothetical protein [Microcoleus sp. PH2017_27_LUM_O_A]TAE94372.1 MAG: hypothetical protein EAZ79_23435 [Oscillatoriales cyanobacterium]